MKSQETMRYRFDIKLGPFLFLAVVFGLIGSSVHAAPWDGLFDWDLAEEPYPGIRHAQVTAASPRLMVVNVLRVDLSRPNIGFHTTPRDADWGQPAPSYPSYTIRTRRRTTSEYVGDSRNAGLNMVAAINAAPWRPWSELSDLGKITYSYADALGLAVSDGQLVSYADGTPSLLIHQNGNVSMQFTSSSGHYSHVQTAVSGFAFVLANGVPSGGTSLEPRTGYGLSQDGRYLTLMTIDGRQSGYSEGAGTIEVGRWLRHFGAWTGINMDGGGSTTMSMVNPQNNAIRMLNRPSQTFLYGARRVGNNLGIVLTSVFLSPDINGDGVVDLSDLAIIAAYWLDTDCEDSQWCQNADLNLDGAVNTHDLQILIDAWLDE